MARFIQLLFVAFGILVPTSAVAETRLDRPNILWITLEDISPDLGCYGSDVADTPHLDAFASQAIRYTKAWSNAGMCAPARATLITGMYPPSTGAQHMRSEVLLPESIRAFPEYLRRAGYYTSNHSKADYNWIAPAETWNVTSPNWRDQGWRKRKKDQPFFTVINITDTHSSQIYWRGESRYRRRAEKLGRQRLHDPADITVPPYYPDLPEIRSDLARYHDNITYADELIGEMLRQLEDDGLADDTIVFIFSDHGRGMPRSKGWCFFSSLHVPLLIRFPDRFSEFAGKAPGSTDDRIVSFVDFAPSVLGLAGIPKPPTMQGRAFLGASTESPRTLAFSFRDRMDERTDLIRSVWDGRYHYIRNYYPHLPWFHHQTRDYPHTQASYKLWQDLADRNQLRGDTAIYMAESRPPEMLFDTLSDPCELDNLIKDASHRDRVLSMRAALRSWQDEVNDLGFAPESYWIEAFESRGDWTPRHTLVRTRRGLYPIDDLRRIADAVGDTDDLGSFREALESSNAPERYWGAIGILASGDQSAETKALLEQHLDDPSLTVRIVIAQTLASLGQSEQSLPVLLEVLRHPNPLIQLSAANAIDHLGRRSQDVQPHLEAFLATNETEMLTSKTLGAKFPLWVLRRTVERLQVSAD